MRFVLEIQYITLWLILGARSRRTSGPPRSTPAGLGRHTCTRSPRVGRSRHSADNACPQHLHSKRYARENDIYTYTGN